MGKSSKCQGPTGCWAMLRSYWVLGTPPPSLWGQPHHSVPTDGCQAGRRSEPSSDSGATHLTLSLLPQPSLVTCHCQHLLHGRAWSQRLPRRVRPGGDGGRFQDSRERHGPPRGGSEGPSAAVTFRTGPEGRPGPAGPGWGTEQDRMTPDQGAYEGTSRGPRAQPTAGTIQV